MSQEKIVSINGGYSIVEKTASDRLIQEAFDICDKAGKSSEDAVKFAQKHARCSFDTVISYVKRTWSKRVSQSRSIKQESNNERQN